MSKIFLAHRAVQDQDRRDRAGHPKPAAPSHGARALAIAASLFVLASGAQAQGIASAANDQGYWGLSIGQSRYDAPCGALAPCDRSGTSVKLTHGRQFKPHSGGELAIADFGKVDRAGGDTRARAATASLVGRVPVDRFTLFGKLGMSYGRTTTTTAVASDVAAGKASGWGPSAGVGVSYDLGSSTALVAEWDRHRMRFAGGGRDDVDNTSIGVRWKF